MDVFPNPATGTVRVRLAERDAQPTDLLTLTDLSGRRVRGTSYGEAYRGWDLSGLSSGVYFVVLRDRSGLVRGRRKLVLQ